jgi:nanoRNase/pAp phosphatase (c-di-AMP/oligoRNAs hydrolase)
MPIKNTLPRTLIKAITSGGNILIFVKGSPDPDVIAASFALKSICDFKKVKATIAAFTNVSLPQNRALIEKLNIPIHFIKSLSELSGYDSYVVLDHQSAWIEEIGTTIPCLIHIDHHTPEDDIAKPKLKYISDDIGAVSTVLAFVLKKLTIDIQPSIMTRIATALIYGIKIDTDGLNHATKTDLDILEWLKSFYDKNLLETIENIPFSEETLTIIGKAVMNSLFYKDSLFCGVGYVSEEHRDSIAVCADYLLKENEVSTVIVFAIIERLKQNGLFLDASIRTSMGSFDLNRYIKIIAAKGGARTYKGAFQVNLDFFNITPDKQALWNIVRETTIAKLKLGRDHFPTVSLDGFFSKIKRKVHRIFKG